MLEEELSGRKGKRGRPKRSFLDVNEDIVVGIMEEDLEDRMRSKLVV